MKANLLLGYFLFLSVGAHFACNSSSNNRANVSYKPSTSAAVETPAIATNDDSKPIPVKKYDYIGCWSNGRGEGLRITKDSIGVSPDYIPAKYREEGDGPKENSILLLLTDRPEGHYFQQYVLIFFREEDLGPMMIIHDYATYQDLLDDKTGGKSGWVRDDCSKSFFPHRKRN